MASQTITCLWSHAVFHSNLICYVYCVPALQAMWVSWICLDRLLGWLIQLCNHFPGELHSYLQYMYCHVLIARIKCTTLICEALMYHTYAGFRLACRIAALIVIFVQNPFAGRGIIQQRLANKSITPPLCPPRQIADSWLQFNLDSDAAQWKPKRRGRWRDVSLKQQAVISGVASMRRAAS